MKKNLSKIIMILICAVLLEVIVFNITSYRTLWENYEEVTFSKEELKNNISQTEDENFIYVDISDINKQIATIKVDFDEFEDFNDYEVYINDESNTYPTLMVRKTYVKDNEKTKYVPLYLSGDVEEVSVRMHKGYKNELAAKSITINEPIPFKFEIKRFAFIFVLLLALYAFSKAKVFNENYSEKNLKQELILLLVTLIFMFLIIGLRGTCIDDLYNEKYVEAIRNGKTYIDVEMVEGFDKLEDPYDPQLRDSYGYVRDEDYMWDTAYYKGHTYMYFGILPILIAFLPYNVIFKKVLPYDAVSMVVAILIVVILKGIYTKILNKYFKEISFKMVVLSYITLLAGSLILFLSNMARVYELTILFGLLFSLMGIYLMLKSMDDEKNQYLDVFLASSCLAFAVACRPNQLLVSLLVVPYLLKLLIENIKNFKNNKKDFFKLIAAVAIPYILVASFLMWFNYIRFENPFEFGSNYQLTITNVRKLGSRLWTIPQGIISALFSIPTIIGEFPFIKSNTNMIPFNGTFYIEGMLGGLFIMSPICFAIFGIFKANKLEKNKELKCLINVSTIVAIIMLILTVIMAGLVPRYLADFAWLYILISIIIVFIFYSNLQSEEAKKLYIKMMTIVTIYTLIYAIFVTISGENDYMRDNDLDKFLYLKNLICFWQ